MDPSVTHPDSFLCKIHEGLLLEPIVLACGHTFCKDCISQWFAYNQTCPNCRTPSNPRNLTVNYQLREVMADVLRPTIIQTSDLYSLHPLSSTRRAHIRTGMFKSRPIVWKSLYCSENNKDKVIDDVKRVFQTFKLLSYPSTVVSLFGVTLDPPGLVQERLSCSLQDVFNQKQAEDGKSFLSIKEAYIIAEDIALALLSFHQSNIVHRDLSAGNVLLKIRANEVVGAKLGDFDDSRSQEATLTQTTLGTLAYMSPQVLSGQDLKANVASDVFSFGIILWGLFTNKDPSRMASNANQLQVQRINKGGAALIDLEFLSEPLKSLVETMVEVDATKRPNSQSVYQYLADESETILKPYFDQEKKVKNGDSLICDYLTKAKELYNNENYSEAIQLFKKGVELGNADSMNYLGECFFNGFGTTKNKKTAAKYFKLGVEHGSVDAMVNLGYALENGFGVRKNIKEAIQLYQKATELSNPVAFLLLGHCFVCGKGVEQSEEKGFALYLNSANLGFSDAMYTVAECFEGGRGVERDKEMAISWYKKAALAGDEDAKTSLEKLGVDLEELKHDSSNNNSNSNINGPVNIPVNNIRSYADRITGAREQRAIGGRNNNEVFTLYFSNLPFSMSEQQLLSWALERNLPVIGVKIKRKPIFSRKRNRTISKPTGNAFVHVRGFDRANDIIDSFSRSLVNGRVVSITMARSHPRSR
ncbi:hypothetical protein P9112_007916 [Eukaryota sp. TZLM1-RC]